jgi:hypothetical protein
MAYVVNTAVSIPITLYDANGAGRSGLTVTSTARLAGSATTVSATSVTDRGNGDYDITITFPSVGTWRITSTATIDGETVPDTTDVQVETAAQADPAAALAAVDITLVSPLSPDGGTLRLIQGDSYAAAQSRQISWDLTGQPDLSAATTTLLIKVGSATVSKVITPTNPASGSPTLTATLTKVETASLDAAQIGVFDVSAAIGSDELTLIRGKVYVTADVTA